jgi:3-hydroxyacyl-[acyl-carrier-protein] dehydratase
MNSTHHRSAADGETGNGKVMQDPKKTYEGKFLFDPDDPIYRNHFPGRPVVPGSLIVQAFMAAAQRMPGVGRGVRGVENFRFKRFVAPGTYAYRLEVTETSGAGPALRCSLYDGDRMVAGGTLL